MYVKDSWTSALNNLRGAKDDDQRYYSEMNWIGSHAILRQLWIEEGERRGYELS